jgi:hypothetical protein
MRTDELIADLAGRAAPVRPLPAPGIRTLRWSALALAAAAAGVAVFGVRRDLAVMIAQPFFVWTAVLALGTAVMAGAAAFVLAVPGAERSPALRASAIALAALWGATLVAATATAGAGFARVSDWYVCFARVAAIALVPALAELAMLRRAAPLRRSLTAWLALAAALALGAVAIQLICPLNDPAHALLGHFGPVAALAWVGAIAGRRLFDAPPAVGASD